MADTRSNHSAREMIVHNVQPPHMPPQQSKAAQELQHRILEELEGIARRQDRQEKDIAELKVRVSCL